MNNNMKGRQFCHYCGSKVKIQDSSVLMCIQGLEETFSDTCLHDWSSLHCLGSHSKMFKAKRPNKSSISKDIHRHFVYSKEKMKFFVELYSYALKK